MICQTCHDTCQVLVVYSGVWSLDACPECVRRAEAEWLAHLYGLPLEAMPMAERIAAE